MKNRDLDSEGYAVMLSTERSTMLVKSYLNQVELLLKDYVSADPFVVYASIIIGIFACKTVLQTRSFRETISYIYLLRCESIIVFIFLIFIDIFRYMNLASLLVLFTSKAIEILQRLFKSNGAIGE